MQELSLMQRFADPALFEQMSKSELMQGALITTLMGMGLTFVILMLLWGVIALITKVINSTEHKAANPMVIAEPQTPQTPAAKAAPVQKQETVGVDNELIAVITAAIAAMEGGTAANHLIVRKISRISGSATSWSRAGSNEAIESRKIY